jgi:hypothetical protein
MIRMARVGTAFTGLGADLAMLILISSAFFGTDRARLFAQFKKLI